MVIPVYSAVVCTLVLMVLLSTLCTTFVFIIQSNAKAIMENRQINVFTEIEVFVDISVSSFNFANMSSKYIANLAAIVT